ncbi:hypothetical protein H8744_15195 [Oscillospiraceae bacterium N12]|jgi:hypothetical protein|uniref:Uncharacterized protein n=1 Tax=Jilunia laotingensis TaxID=2763675 RepID=A0A926IR77_9BACT|nr:hypothetical protein [Jilunia laotingensis]MBC8594556.1 hypothetical protein [Jilunia laotingensis]
MIYFFLWIIFSIGVASEGGKRTCGFFYSLLCSLILSPLIGLIWVLCCEKLSDIEYRKQQLEATLIQKMKDAAELHDKGLMSDFDFEKMKLEYENRNKKDTVINPVNRILKMK